MLSKFWQISVVLAFVLFIVLLNIIAVDNQFNVKALKPSQYYQWVEQNKPIIIDLREGNEIFQNPLNYQPVINLPFLQIENKMDSINLPETEKVLFVCSDGNRSRLICSLLKNKSPNIYYLKHGLKSLPEPVEK
ncbi:MAG: rhodanese-like domain-containing protein, partial [Calditrichota bacterium]